MLGDRIGIMKHGNFIALGTSLHLKQKFGSGYRITTVVDKQHQAPVIEFVQQQLPGASVLSQDHNSVKFKVPTRYTDKLASFFVSLEKQQQSFQISDTQLSLTTLVSLQLTWATHALSLLLSVPSAMSGLRSIVR